MIFGNTTGILNLFMHDTFGYSGDFEGIITLSLPPMV